MKADAIIWDYDGTLVNSVTRNIDITKQILGAVAPGLTGENLPACLISEEADHIVNHKSKNWQDLCTRWRPRQRVTDVASQSRLRGRKRQRRRTTINFSEQ